MEERGESPTMIRTGGYLFEVISCTRNCPLCLIGNDLSDCFPAYLLLSLVLTSPTEEHHQESATNTKVEKRGRVVVKTD